MFSGKISFAVIVCLYFTVLSTGQLENKGLVDSASHRSKRWIGFPFAYPYLKRPLVPRVACIGTNNLEGICLTQANCDKQQGICSGHCPNKKGVCCVFQRTCGGSTNAAVSYFINEDYPNPFSGGTRCSVTINKAATYVCQLRLDFIDLSLAQPLNNGTCYNDFFSLGSSSLPSLCGENGGLHAYVDFSTRCASHVLSVDTNANADFGRKWNIKVSQIACNSTRLAPKGCLMYFTKTSGSVTSFNYDASVPPHAIDEPWTRQLNGLNYGICVRPNEGYCTIEWRPSSSSSYTFTISDDTTAITSTNPGLPLNGVDCTHNFIVIPNPTQPGNPNLRTDRFCGNQLISTSSSSKPFVLTVVTNNMFPPDNANRGFHLNYRQIPC